MSECTYSIEIGFHSNEPISESDLIELGREIVNATESFMKSKRKNIRMGGTIDIKEAV